MSRKEDGLRKNLEWPFQLIAGFGNELGCCSYGQSAANILDKTSQVI